MTVARKVFISLAALWVAATVQAPAAVQTTEFKLFTTNCYCFDETQSKLLKGGTWLGSKLASVVGMGDKVKVTDLHSGITKSISQRRREIADRVIASGADVVFFQELWNGENKNAMINLVSKKFKYCYLNSKIRPGMTEVDDGLLMASKWPPFFTYSEEYEKKYDDEAHAHKGFLMMGLYIPGGGFLVVINTHFQSGTDDEACKVRNHQIGQIARAYKDLAKTDWRIQNAKILFGGDVNEPITMKAGGDDYRNGGCDLHDRTRRLVDRFHEVGLPVDNDQTLSFLCRKYRANQVLNVDQVGRKGAVRQVDLAKPPGKWPIQSLAAGDGWIGRFGGSAKDWTYFPMATEPSGRQMLDHLFLDPSIATLVDISVMRLEFLGDPGDPANRPSYDGVVAIADHAGVLFRILLRSYL